VGIPAASELDANKKSPLNATALFSAGIRIVQFMLMVRLGAAPCKPSVTRRGASQGGGGDTAWRRRGLDVQYGPIKRSQTAGWRYVEPARKALVEKVMIENWHLS